MRYLTSLEVNATVHTLSQPIEALGGHVIITKQPSAFHLLTPTLSMLHHPTRFPASC